MIEVKSNERQDWKVFYGLGLITSLLVFYLIYLALSPTGGSGAWIAAFFFGLFSALFWVIGAYHKRRFYKLGFTPLFLENETIRIGDTIRGTIRINQPNFTKIRNVKITSVVYDKTLETYDDLHSAIAPCEIEASGNTTDLNFIVEVPFNGRPSEQTKLRVYSWQMSVEYKEDLSLIKRSWKIKVEPAITTIMDA